MRGLWRRRRLLLLQTCRFSQATERAGAEHAAAKIWREMQGGPTGHEGLLYWLEVACKPMIGGRSSLYCTQQAGLQTVGQAGMSRQLHSRFHQRLHLCAASLRLQCSRHPRLHVLSSAVAAVDAPFSLAF